MYQLEFLVVRVRLRLNDVHAPSARVQMTWSDLPEQAKLEVVKHVAEMLRVHQERCVAGEANHE